MYQCFGVGEKECAEELFGSFRACQQQIWPQIGETYKTMEEFLRSVAACGPRHYADKMAAKHPNSTTCSPIKGE